MNPSAVSLFSAFSVALRRWVYLLMALAVIAVTGVTSMLNEKGRESIDLSMNGSRVVYGLTFASSYHGFGSPLYGFYQPIFNLFHAKETVSWDEVNGLIDKALALDPNTLSPDQLHKGFGELDEDDKGVILWYSWAFSLFGPSLESIYLLYFLMLSASLTVCWLAFRGDETALALMTLYALTHMALAAFALAGNTNVIGSLFGTRPFAMLAIPPTFHLVLLMLRQLPPSRWLLAGAAAQIIYLLLIMEVRSSARIQLLFIFLIAAFTLLRWMVNTEKGRFLRWRQIWFSRSLFRPAFVWVPVALVAGLMGAKAAYLLAIPSEIRAQATTGHLVWYPALAGFVQNPVLHDELFQFSLMHKQPGVDTGIYDAQGNIRTSPSHDALARISVIGFARNVLHEDVTKFVIGGPDNRNANLYEQYARKLFFYELRKHPVEMARLYIATKSKNLILLLRQVLKQLQSADILIAAFMVGLLCGSAWLRGLWTTVPLIAAGFAVASIPAYWFVPGTSIMFDYAPYFYLGYLAIIATMGASVSWISARYSLIRYMQPLLRLARPILAISVVPLAIGGMLLAARMPDEADKSTIIIVSATYGENVKAPHGNATEKTRQACNSREVCEYTVDVNVLSDPASGKRKNFIVEYQCSHVLKPVRKIIPEEAHNQKISLDCRA